MKYNVIIIGAGQAGFTVALSLRKRKYKGSILLVGDEKYLPYQRPPLSKDFLSDEVEVQRLLIKPETFFEAHKIKVLTKSPVRKINNQTKTVELKNNKSFEYEKLVVCAGSRVRKITLSCQQDRIHYLRTITDAIKIKSSLESAKEIAILGGGYIGLELAASAIKKGLKVRLIEMEDRLMKRSLSKSMAKFIENKHLLKGVEILLNTSVEDINDFNDKKSILLTNGERLDVDTVIIGVGIEPNIDLALQAGVHCSNGIDVNEYGQTSDPNIFAAGDCTCHPNKIFDKKLRLESVQNASDQAKAVAASIMGLKEPYAKTPWFWSDQYNLKLKIAGLTQNYDYEFFQGDAKNEKFAIFFIKDNKLIGVESVNHQKAFLLGRKLIGNQSIIPEDKTNFFN
tara:strand:- start:1384 stop:2574 length:1191 start_codon:yes stop_codon:yes gene_type:complete